MKYRFNGNSFKRFLFIKRVMFFICTNIGNSHLSSALSALSQPHTIDRPSQLHFAFFDESLLAYKGLWLHKQTGFSRKYGMVAGEEAQNKALSRVPTRWTCYEAKTSTCCTFWMCSAQRSQNPGQVLHKHLQNEFLGKLLTRPSISQGFFPLAIG